MAESRFELNGFFQFDLAQGSVRARGGERVLLLSEEVLAPLIATAVNHGDLTPVRSLGSYLGNLVEEALPGAPAALPIGQVVGCAGTVVALFGFGRLKLERWGDALVLDVDGLPPVDADNLAVAALLGGIFSSLCRIEVACVPLAPSTKYIMVDPTIAEQVWSWSKGGDSLATIAGRLGPMDGMADA